MKIYLGCDHAAFEVKTKVKSLIESLGHEVVDLGTNSEERCHYPEYAKKVVTEVLKNKGRGILMCGSGQGMSMVANKDKGIRAALCRTEEESILSRQHNDSNILCLGARTTDYNELVKVTKAGLATEFEGGRHSERLEMFSELGTII